MREHYTPNEASYGMSGRIGKRGSSAAPAKADGTHQRAGQDGRSMMPSSNARSTVSRLEWVPSLR